MAGTDGQYKTWLELVGEILQQPLGMSSGREGQVLDLLSQSLNGACSTRNRVDLPWDNHILACWPPDFMPNEPPGDYAMSQQPLLRWYAFTGQTGPQSLGRVPDALAGSGLKRGWEEVARPWGLIHQLSIPLQIGGDNHHAYLIYRPDRDFTEQELALAALLQPILTGLALHVGLASSSNEASLGSATHGLTLREMAILALLSEGLTADSLARRLGISPRTAGKHLEHIYRKLDVRDRLMAVQRAHEWGLITTSPGDFHTVRPRQDSARSPWS